MFNLKILLSDVAVVKQKHHNPMTALAKYLHISSCNSLFVKSYHSQGLLCIFLFYIPTRNSSKLVHLECRFCVLDRKDLPHVRHSLLTTLLPYLRILVKSPIFLDQKKKNRLHINLINSSLPTVLFTVHVENVYYI